MEIWSKSKIEKLISQNPIVIFGKGTKASPQCGYTLRAIQIIEQCYEIFVVVNIFDDPSIKQNLKKVSEWPTTPQIFIGGNFVGGSDIIMELFQSGELQKLIDLAIS